MGKDELRLMQMGKMNSSLQQEVYYKLESFEEAVKELLRLSEMTPGQHKGLSQNNMEFLYRTLTEDVCRKCPKYRTCFGEYQEKTLREITTILEQAGEKSRMDGRLASEDFRKNCVFFQPFIEELSWLYRLLYQNNYWENRLIELKQVMKKQLMSQYILMKECKRQLSYGREVKGFKKRKLRLLLLQKGFYLKEVWEYPDDNNLLEIFLAARPMTGPGRTSGIALCLSAVYQKEICCQQGDIWLRRGENRLSFVEEGSFHVIFGRKHCNKKGENICGDTFSFTNYNRKRAVMLLSDGMGVGESAYKNSRKLIETFEAMLEAGIQEEYALEILHNALLMQEDHDFSTLDAAVISLQTGMLKMLKAGGTATFIRHGQAVERIMPDSLPPGCLVEQQFDLKYKKLYDGDMVIMVSDGMLDFENTEEISFRMETILEQITTNNAQTFAQQLMEAIPAPDSGYDDDRTVLVAAVWEKGRKNVG